MGVAYYPEFEREIPGYDPSVAVSGKAVARAMDQLEAICKRLGLTPLLDFYSESNEEAFDKIGEEVPPDLRDEPIKWSEPELGLRTASGLIEHLTNHPDELPDVARVCEDLEAFRQVFKTARSTKAGFACGSMFEARRRQRTRSQNPVPAAPAGAPAACRGGRRLGAGRINQEFPAV